MDAAVELHDVTFAYHVRPVLEQVNLSLAPGAFASFVGPNGGGKSTLFKLVLGLLRPQQGRIRVFGEAPEGARARLGYVPQEFVFDRHFPMRVRDVVQMGCLGPGRRWGRRRLRVGVAEALRQVDLSDHGDRWFSGLSGGQRKRVLIARALAAQPEMLLLDEPTANVDAAAKEEILSVLEQLRGRMTILLVTHTAEVAARFLEAIVCVNRHVHIHPATDVVDERLMRHICGYEAPPASEDHQHVTGAAES